VTGGRAIVVNVIVEGPTEEAFVKRLLKETFVPLGIHLKPKLLGVRGHQGGRTSYARVRSDVLIQLKQDRASYCTTMIDFYGLGKGFPVIGLSQSKSTRDRVQRIESEWKKDIHEEIPDLRSDLRFIPHLCIHEFESLLFSDPQILAEAAQHPNLGVQLRRIRDAFNTPEDINDSPDSAPSKQILKLIPLYKKVDDGTLAAQKIGLAKMREQCPHFREWIERLLSITPIP
jgi:hypothetical protein